MMGADDESDEGTEAGLPAGIPTPQQNPSGVEFQHQLAAPPLSSLPQPEVPVPMEDGPKDWQIRKSPGPLPM